jgi:hypothetical protein
LTIEPTTPKPSATLANLLAMTKAMEVNQVCGTKNEATRSLPMSPVGWTPRPLTFSNPASRARFAFAFRREQLRAHSSVSFSSLQHCKQWYDWDRFLP